MYIFSSTFLENLNINFKYARNNNLVACINTKVTLSLPDRIHRHRRNAVQERLYGTRAVEVVIDFVDRDFVRYSVKEVESTD